MLRLAERTVRASAGAPLQRILEHILRRTPARVPAEWVQRCAELVVTAHGWQAAELLVLWLQTGMADVQWARAFLRAHPEVILGARLRAFKGLHQLLPLAESWAYLARIASRVGHNRLPRSILDPASYGPEAADALTSLSRAASLESEQAVAAVLRDWESDLRIQLTARGANSE